MIDYLFTWVSSSAETLKRTFFKIRPDFDESKLMVWQGEWGALVLIGHFYPGFKPIETERYIFVVLGGPLPVETGYYGAGKTDDRHSSRILEKWISGSINYTQDFLGGFQFLRVDKIAFELDVVTDAAGFIPCYATAAFVEGRINEQAIFGSHVDAVAVAAGESNQIDNISVVDFLIYQTVTFPYTFYSHIKQMSPACKVRFERGCSASESPYWIPSEEGQYEYFEDCAEALHQILSENVKRAAHSGDALTMMMSGGEDSRSVLSVLAYDRDKQVEAFTVADSYNREAKVAETVSQVLGAKWRLLIRPETHYLEHAESSVKLSESHNFFYHAHFNGFVGSICRGHPVLGGLMADALCKGSHLYKKKSFGVVTEIKPDQWENFGSAKRFQPQKNLFAEVKKRRENWNSCIRTLRPKSWAEWHSLYPATMNTDLTNYFVNRRLFFVFEPFADGRILHWSAKTPAHWKINRKVFQAAMKPLLKRTWYIRHSKGTFPYWGWRLNGPFSLLLEYQEKLMKKYRKLRGLPKNNQGPWPVWKNVVKNKKFIELAAFNEGSEKLTAKKLLGENVFEVLLESIDHKDPIQALAGLHVRLWLKMVLAEKSFNTNNSRTKN